MATSITHKRGDTFLYDAVLRQSKSGPVIDLTDWTIASMIRDGEDVLIEELTVTVTNAALGEYSIRVDDTTAWPVGTAYWDIQYTDSNDIIRSTDTMNLNIIEDVTYPEPAE
jgi:hypothetical protein